MKNLTCRGRPYLLRSSSASDKGGAGSSEGGAELRDRRTAEGEESPNDIGVGTSK